jgi:hypothetical protein
MKNSGEAVIEGGNIVIRVPLEALQTVLDGSNPMYAIAERYRIVDGDTFAKEVCRAVNREDERGDTPFHKMFDEAMEYAISQGCEGLEEIPGAADQYD